MDRLVNIIKKYKIHIILFLAAFFIYDLSNFFIGYTLAGWDEYYYFIGAKNILQNHVYLVDGKPPQYPMGYPLLIVPFFYLLGISEYSAAIPSIILGALTVVLLYEFIRDLIDMRAALFAALFLMFSYHWMLITDIRSDPPALFFFLLGIFAAVKYTKTEGKKFVYLFYFAAGFACLIRYTSGLIFIIVLLYILLSKRVYLLKHKEVWIGVLLFFAILSPQMIYNYAHFGSIFATGYSPTNPMYVPKIFSHPKFNQSWMIENAKILILGFGTPIFPFFLYGIWDWFNNRNHEELSLIIPWMAVFFMFFQFYWFSTESVARYLYPIFPAMLILAGNGFSKMCSKFIIKTDKNKLRVDRDVFIKKTLVIFLVIILLLPTVLFWLNTLQKGHAYAILKKETFTWIHENLDKDDIILSAPSKDCIAFAYYSQHEIYSLELPKNDLKRLISTHNNTYIAIRTKWRDQLGEGKWHEISDTVQWLNETYDLIHLKTFETKPSGFAPSSELIFLVGNKIGLISPYGDRWDIFLVKSTKVEER
ncbi:hypothetical protein CW713_12415 [Methanophagales archaeon]|nr:MAG: hypothetical protein CW713_12415 [Methanophagales archaeon]